ncbi:MAG: signal peptidase I [Acidobacteria bacterium]|nr:signal peptidase I [Acidobacteriota bacterium]
MASALKSEGEDSVEHSEVTPSDAQDEREQAGPPRSLLREYFESGVVTIIMALFFMTFVAQAAEVPSASMENTIYVGDRFLINKFIFAPGPVVPFLPQREIRRGDIIVFKYPSDIGTNEEIIRYKTLFIKRVIGLPGETIEVRGPNVYADGKLLPEYHVTALDPKLGNDKAELKDLSYPPGKNGEPYTVFYSPSTINENPARTAASSGFNYAVKKPHKIPENEYFMMGDNRDNSAAPRSDGPLGFLADFVNNTRWSRTGTLIR